ncbi:MAG: hypothetical protein IKV10_04280, partial [Alphaproteobacteria bacterium]|nr:hypothetical protein [Alphaproteobacteria bacterium]
MEKWYVKESTPPKSDYLCQTLTLGLKNNIQERTIVVNSPHVPVGTKIKIYTDKKYKYLTIATSYKIKDRRHITLNLSPYSSVSSIKHFYKRFSVVDGIRFNIDLIQTLSQQGIMPS